MAAKAARKAAAKPSRASAAKRPARRSSAKRAPAKQIKQAVTTHPFAPGTRLGVYRAAAIEVEARQGDAPFSDPISTVTVAKDGTVEIAVPRKGAYTIVGERPDGRYAYVGVGVT